jgi:hypothetical protein
MFIINGTKLPLSDFHIQPSRIPTTTIAARKSPGQSAPARCSATAAGFLLCLLVFTLSDNVDK